MYPFGGLPENLAAFGDFLRRRHGFRIGPGEMLDATRSIEVVDLASESAVRNALRAVFCRTVDDVAVFDRAFTNFFFPAAAGIPQEALEPFRSEAEPESARQEKRSRARHHAAGTAEIDQGLDVAGGAFTPLATEESGNVPALLARARYSPLESAGEAPELRRAEPAWRDAARVFVRRLHLGPSRRWQSAEKGLRFDLRRTLRASLQTGGEPLSPRWLRRRRRKPRFVLLIDGSRSMAPYATSALQIGVAMAGVTTRLEVFAFSTAFRSVSNDVRRAAAGEPRRLDHLQYAWAGGTHIGRCLHQFLRQYGERAIGRDTVVIIVSDGLDVGEPDLLREAMQGLSRRSAAVVWLNPLLATPGYEPTAAGMRAARPYITTFACANDVAQFAQLSHRVRLPH